MKFIKKPVIIEAIQWTCTNYDMICAFCKGQYIEPIGNGQLKIPTLEGGHIASLNDWIIKGIKGEFYPCKPDIFEMTYEPVKEVKNG